MWSPRNAVLAAVFVFVAAIGSAWIALLQIPDSGGVGHDCFGVQGHGYRGVFDTARELGFHVRRQLAPPQPQDSTQTLVCIEPSPALLRTHPAYLKRLKEWVTAGGRLVLVLPSAIESSRDYLSACKACGNDCDLTPTNLLDLIGLGEVSLDSPALNSRRSNGRQSLPGRTGSSLPEISGWDALVAAAKPYQQTVVEVDVEATGGFATTEIDRLAMESNSRQYLDCSNSMPIGVIALVEDAVEPNETPVPTRDPASTGETDASSASDSDERTEIANADETTRPRSRVLVAEFAQGAGTIVVVSDPSLFRNRTFAKADNSVMAVRVLGNPPGELVFDEYYHGLSARGNPLFLLTRPGFAAMALGMLAIAGVVLWRKAVWLGPPVESVATPRRDIAEFLRAMGRLYAHSSQTRPLLVQQFRAGVVRRLSSELGLPPDQQDTALVARLLARHSEAHADQFLETIADVDKQLRSTKFWSETQTLRMMRKLTACLSTPT